MTLRRCRGGKSSFYQWLEYILLCSASSRQVEKNTVADKEETFGQEIPLPQLSNRAVLPLPQRTRRKNDRHQHTVEEECRRAPDQQMSRAVDNRGSAEYSGVRKSNTFVSHSLPLPSRSAAYVAQARTPSPSLGENVSTPAKKVTECSHTLGKMTSSSVLFQSKTPRKH